MRVFLRCIREAWKASRKREGFFYNTLVEEDYGDRFHNLAASVIEEEDVQTDLKDVLLKTPRMKDSVSSQAYHNKLDTFVFEGKLE